jgi:hypothetical protein
LECATSEFADNYTGLLSIILPSGRLFPLHTHSAGVNPNGKKQQDEVWVRF